MADKEIITEAQKKTARYAKAMGHPIRMYVLELLSKQSCCYSGDLSEELPIVKSTLSQHLKELKEAGLIQGERSKHQESNIASIKKTGERPVNYSRDY